MTFSCIKSMFLRLNANSSATPLLIPLVYHRGLTITKLTTTSINHNKLNNVLHEPRFLLLNHTMSRSTSNSFSSRLLTNKPKTDLWSKLSWNKGTNNKSNICCWFEWFIKRFRSRCSISMAVLVATICLVRIERVPFSERDHVVVKWSKIFPSFIIDKCSDFLLFKKCGCDRDGVRILPPTDPRTIRFTNMVREIAQVMHSKLELKKDSLVITYNPRPNPYKPIQHRIRSTSLHSKDRMYGKGYGTKHLEGQTWKVVVINSGSERASILPNGTIVIHTGLSTLPDAELATAIGHEFGHYIARHYIDYSLFPVKYYVGVIPSAFMMDVLTPQYTPSPKRYKYLFNSLLSYHKKRREFEADYIRMMLMASAGYNPEMASKHYEREFYKYYKHNDYLSSHPSSPLRCKSLQDQLRFNTAMDAYKQAQLN